MNNNISSTVLKEKDMSDFKPVYIYKGHVGYTHRYEVMLWPVEPVQEYKSYIDEIDILSLEEVETLRLRYFSVV